MELPQNTQEKIKKLQEYEQKIQTLTLQRQKLDSQQGEVESAMSALDDKSAGEAFKIIGNVMVSSDKPTLKKELSEQKRKLELRATTLEKQQDQLKQVAEALQKEVLKHIEGKK